MALHYLVDGYNIVKSLPDLADKPIDAGRLTLIRWLEIYRPQGSSKNLVTIVFDGQSGIDHVQTPSSVKVIFSQDESADDKIRKIVEDSDFKKRLVVVTDDRELKFSVRALGASVMAVKDFLAQAKPRGQSEVPGTGQKNKPETEKYISKTVEYKINAELEKIWLKK